MALNMLSGTLTAMALLSDFRANSNQAITTTVIWNFNRAARIGVATITSIGAKILHGLLRGYFYV